MVTSYCPDGVAASEAVLESPATIRTFYDLDAPVTLARLEAGEAVEYIGPRGLVEFDLVLSYTGGRALTELQASLGARRVAPLYGSVDPDAYRRTDTVARYRADLSYLGTYAADRQPALEEFLVEPARRLPRRRFVIGGAQYPVEFSLGRQHLFRATPAARRASRLLQLVAAHPEHHARGHGPDGPLSLGPAVRGRGLRHAHPDRCLGGPRRLLPPRIRDSGGP
jgi:hypothetical protein